MSAPVQVLSKTLLLSEQTDVWTNSPYQPTSRRLYVTAQVKISQAVGRSIVSYLVAFLAAARPLSLGKSLFGWSLTRYTRIIQWPLVKTSSKYFRFTWWASKESSLATATAAAAVAAQGSRMTNLVHCMVTPCKPVLQAHKLPPSFMF